MKKLSLKNTRKIFPILSLSLLFMSSTELDNPAPKPLVSDMLNNIRDLKSAQFTIVMKERTDGVLVQKKAFFKIQSHPIKVYIKQEYPNKNMEILYVEGENKNKALLSLKKFPYMVLNLDPLGNTMRNGQHYSVMKAGFDFFVEIIDHLFEKYREELGQMLKYEGIVKYNNVVCHKIVFENPYFKYLPYKVSGNETLEDISWKLLVSDYMILEYNPAVKSFENLDPDMELMVPCDFAKTIILYIDEVNHLPVGIKTFDDKGLFDEYNYENIVLNPDFKPVDFDRNNPDYRF